MAATTSTSQAELILSEILGDAALEEARPRVVNLQFANQYSIAGSGSKVLKLNRYDDIGTAGTATEGTDYTTETEQTLSQVSATPTEAAVLMSQVTDDCAELTGRFESVNAMLASNDLDAQLAVLRPFAANLGRAAFEKAETDSIAEFANLSTSVGTTTVAFDLGKFEEAIYNLDIAEPMNRDYVAVLSPRQISDLRRILLVTSGGVQGTMYTGQNADHNDNINGFQYNLFGVNVFQYDKSAELTANAAADTVGAMYVAGTGQPEMGGGGTPGTYAFVEGRAMDYRVAYELRARAADVMVNWKYDILERVDAWGVKIISAI